MTAADDRPLMNLGHLAIPNVSGAAAWLGVQAEQRERAVDIAAHAITSHLPNLPASLVRGVAERVVIDLDHQV